MVLFHVETSMMVEEIWMMVLDMEIEIASSGFGYVLQFISHLTNLFFDKRLVDPNGHAKIMRTVEKT